MVDEKKIIQALKKNGRTGLIIRELADVLNVSRVSVRVPLARLEALKKVGIRRAGMAKVYYLTGGKNGKRRGRS